MYTHCTKRYTCICYLIIATILWAPAETESETNIWVQVCIWEVIAKNTGREVEKWGRERKAVRKGALSQAVSTVGNWISTRPGSSGIWCRLCTSVSHSRRQGAETVIRLPLVPALSFSSLEFPAAWLVSRTVFGSVRKPPRKRNTGAGNKKLGQRAQKWYEPKRYGGSTECLLAPLGWVLPHLTNEET